MAWYFVISTAVILLALWFMYAVVSQRAEERHVRVLVNLNCYHLLAKQGWENAGDTASLARVAAERVLRRFE